MNQFAVASLIVFDWPGGSEEQLPQEVAGELGEGEGDWTPQGAQNSRRVVQAHSGVPHRQAAHIQQDPRRVGAGQVNGNGGKLKRIVYSGRTKKEIQSSIPVDFVEFEELFLFNLQPFL